MATPETPQQIAAAEKAFEAWAALRTGFTRRQLLELYARGTKLTPQELAYLQAKITQEEKAAAAIKPVTPPTPKPPTQPTVKPELIIARTPYPKWWKDAYAWDIDIDTAGEHIVIPQTPGYRTYLATIVLTVDGEVNITFTFGPFPPSGAMDFGGENEPRGMVISTGNSPIPCGGGGFKITTDADVHVGGFITYFYESEKET